MNYKLSFPEMDRFAQQVKSRKANISLAQMREQVARVKNNSIQAVRKKLSGK
jgi:glutamyl-tRNA reductase